MARPRMTTWRRVEQLDEGTALASEVPIPQVDTVEVPRDFLERVMREAGWEPDE